MKTRAVILAGGEGSRLGVLTAKRTKPAVMFAGKYRIIDFTLSNCVNSGITDVMLIAQYRPHSLIEHIGAGSPWDLNRDFTGGVRIYTPYRTRQYADWFTGTADAIQQNFAFIKRGKPDLILILSGDHIYSMDYEALITFHLDHHADLTMATIQVNTEEAHRFGIVGVNPDYRVTSFVEKPQDPPSTLANMGVYVFSREVLDRVLWEDHLRVNSSHDFGKDIIPHMVSGQDRVFAFPYSGYWVDVGTVSSYWQAHMDLLKSPPPMDLHDRDWVIHTRTEERPPVWISSGADVQDSMITDGCIIEAGARVIRSILSPGVVIHAGAVVEESVLLTDVEVNEGAHVQRSILDKRVHVGKNSLIGGDTADQNPQISMVGKNAILPDQIIIRPGASVGADVTPEDFDHLEIESGEFVQTRRLPNEI
ncbi:MAG: glucose-1-phosphate adenylyltransferase [Anaerolineaceae bacterium]